LADQKRLTIFLEHAQRKPHASLSERLIKAASKVLERPACFRERHGLSGAMNDIQISAMVCGWPESRAKQIARAMLAAGVSPMGARVLFAESERVRQ
jgi:hypothetical protein